VVSLFVGPGLYDDAVAVLADDATDSDGDDDGDADDVGDDDCDVAEIEDGEDVEFEVSIEDGKIVSVDVSHSAHDEREAEIRLHRSVESDDPDVEGQAKLESRDDRQRLKVEAEHLDAGRDVEAFAIDAAGVEASLGVRTVGLDGEAEWEIEDGALPFGATTVEDLLGFGIEVRDATTGTVLLFGSLPDELPSHADEDEHGEEEEDEAEGRARLTPAAGVTGEADVEVESEGDEQQLEVEAEHLASGTVIDAYIEDPANPGTLVLVGTFAVGSEGEGELEFDTHDGDALPFGVASVSALVGLAIELRDAGTGAVLFSGHVPALVAED
jgi:hypothetical protein